MNFFVRGGERVPLLDFVEAREEGDGDEDDDCFFAVADFELWGLERGRVSLCADISGSFVVGLEFDNRYGSSSQ